MRDLSIVPSTCILAHDRRSSHTLSLTMQLINRIFLSVAIMAAIVAAAPACSHEDHQHGSSNFPRVSPGDTVTADGEVVPAKRQLAEEAKVIGGDNPTNITVEVRLPDSLNITTPAPIAEEFARYNRKWVSKRWSGTCAPVHFAHLPFSFHRPQSTTPKLRTLLAG